MPRLAKTTSFNKILGFPQKRFGQYSQETIEFFEKDTTL